MNKQETQMLKGIAILLMLFLHLFGPIETSELYVSVFHINDLPLSYILARATNPVSFFLFLGGYGLYFINKKKDKNQYKRVFKLYIHYWIIMLIFVSIGYFILPSKYPGSLTQFLNNLTSYKTNYDGPCWFLLPYAALSLSAPILFKLMNRFKVIYVVGITWLIGLTTSFFISRFNSILLNDLYWIYNPILYFHLLFSFTLGAMACRANWIEKFKLFVKSNNLSHFVIIALLILIGGRCCIKTGAFDAFYTLIFILLFNCIKLPTIIAGTLERLGNNSMNMWMIHTYFSIYLFQNFIYGFKYPVIIFLVLVVISYLSSKVIDFIANPLTQQLYLKRAIK